MEFADFVTVLRNTLKWTTFSGQNFPMYNTRIRDKFRKWHILLTERNKYIFLPIIAAALTTVIEDNLFNFMSIAENLRLSPLALLPM
jgi:hypothetical protein